MRPIGLQKIFSTLYTTLPHNSIIGTLIDFIEWIFQREGSPYLVSNSFTSEEQKNIIHGLVKMYVIC